jgi:hypothetical protein
MPTRCASSSTPPLIGCWRVQQAIPKAAVLATAEFATLCLFKEEPPPAGSVEQVAAHRVFLDQGAATGDEGFHFGRLAPVPGAQGRNRERSGGMWIGNRGKGQFVAEGDQGWAGRTMRSETQSLVPTRA